MDSSRSRLDGQIWCADCREYHLVGMHSTPQENKHICKCKEKCTENEYDKLLNEWQKQINTLKSIQNWTAVNKDIVEAEINILQKCYSQLYAICKKI